MGRLSRSVISWTALRRARRWPARAAAPASRAKSCSSAVPGAKAVNSTTSRSTAPARGTGGPDRGYDRLPGQRGERPRGGEPGLREPPVRVGIERQHGNGLRGEELPLLPRRDDERAPGFGPGCCYPSHELPFAPPHTERGTGNAERGTGAGSWVECSAFRVPHSAFDRFDDLLRSPVQPFQAVGPHVREPH